MRGLIGIHNIETGIKTCQQVWTICAPEKISIPIAHGAYYYSQISPINAILVLYRNSHFFSSISKKLK